MRIPTLVFEEKRMRVAYRGKECSVPDLLGESILQNQLQFRLEEDEEIYQGYGRRNTAYPYRQYNAYTRELTEQSVKTAVLEKESRSLTCRMRIVNEGEEVIPMYWWSNMAVPEYVGGRVVVPAKSAFTYAEGVVYKVDTPIVDGVDVTDYRTIPTSMDYFFDIPKEEPKYIANLDGTGYGLLHVSTERLKSRKLFTWGNLDGSDHWQEFLTDQAGRYLEIQAGLGKTQYGCIPMAPNTAWEWIEQYGSVQVPVEEIFRDRNVALSLSDRGSR